MKSRGMPAMGWALALLLCGCATGGYGDYNESLHETLKYATPEAMAEHTLLLGRILEQAELNGVLPPPGVAAEYGFNMAVMGNSDTGIEYLDKEVAYYPESRLLVEALKRIIEDRDEILTEPLEPAREEK